MSVCLIHFYFCAFTSVYDESLSLFQSHIHIAVYLIQSIYSIIWNDAVILIFGVQRNSNNNKNMNDKLSTFSKKSINNVRFLIVSISSAILFYHDENRCNCNLPVFHFITYDYQIGLQIFFVQFNLKFRRKTTLTLCTIRAVCFTLTYLLLITLKFFALTFQSLKWKGTKNCSRVAQYPNCTHFMDLWWSLNYWFLMNFSCLLHIFKRFCIRH